MPARILLITPVFYGVEKTIKSLLEQSDYEVTWIENKTLPLDYHGTRAKFRLLRKIYFLLFFPKFRYLRKELNKIRNIKFDILFAINGHIICPYLFRKLKKSNPRLFSVLYLWDSFSMFNWRKELILFEKVFTFDPDDSLRYHIEYKPNFYVKSSKSNIQKIEYDLFFAGKFSPERLIMIDKIRKLPGIIGISFFLRLWPAYKALIHNQFFYHLAKIFNSESRWIRNYSINYEAVEGLLKREYFIADCLDYKEVQAHSLSSNVILDLPYEGQTGYTHRLIEALANGKKIITTNTDIRKESFFNPDQIKLLDGQNPVINVSWIRERAVFPVDRGIADLDLSVWLKSMIDVRMA